jgi:ribosomal protein S18 acetylase RimI-like enzyme
MAAKLPNADVLHSTSQSDTQTVCATRVSVAIEAYPAAIADLDGLARVLTLVFYPPTGFQSFIWPLLNLNVRADLRRRLLKSPTHYCCLGAWANGQLVGMLEVGLRRTNAAAWSSQRQPYIANLAVLPHWRRCGVATRLLQVAETVVQLWGYSRIYLHVLESNIVARHLYAAVGYDIQAEQDNPWTFLGVSQQLLLFKQL